MEGNILFVLGRYPSIGGVESVTTNLANEFAKLGHQVHIVSFEAVCSLEQMGLDENVKTLVLSYPVYTPKNIVKLSAYIRDNQIKYVLNGWCLPFYVTRLIKKCIRDTSCRYIAIHHSNPITNARLKSVEIDIEENKGLYFVNKIKWHIIDFISRLSLKYVYHHCDRLVLLSSSFISPLKEYIWESDSSKMIVIPNSFETKADGNRFPKIKEILYVGRIDYYLKRVRRVIEIWNRLESRYPDWRLTIVGDGPDLKTLKQMVSNYNLRNVRFEGFQKPDEYFQRAPIMLLVSECEGFGVVLVEAQSYGCVPVVLDSYSALHDIVKDKVNGVIVEYPYQTDAFVSKISSLIEHNSLLEEYEMNAIKSVDKYRIQNIVNKWLNLFEEYV